MGEGEPLIFPLAPMTASRPSILTIGNFDGVHVGHAALVGRARELANEGAAAVGAEAGAEVVVLAFDPHPSAVLRPGNEPARLTSWGQRERRLKEAGADRVVRLVPTAELLATSPADFVTGLVRDYRPRGIVEGPDFRFGKGRGGDMALLGLMGKQHGFAVNVVEPVEVVLDDGAAVRASSTLARWLIERGRMADAAAVLGRGYEVEGIVVRGDRRGRTIGYPTANVRTECLLPGDGVYAGMAELPGGKRFPAAISVGSKPTFGEHARALEAFVLTGANLSREEWRPLDGLPEYGWPLRLEIRHWLRAQAKYGSLEALLEQMDRDCRRTREMMNTPHASPRGDIACR
jgi:riboflavin kinase / FMN adenylyltransferase